MDFNHLRNNNVLYCILSKNKSNFLLICSVNCFALQLQLLASRRCCSLLPASTVSGASTTFLPFLIIPVVTAELVQLSVQKPD